MESFKKTLRLLGLVLLITLATVGIGLGGGVLVPASSKREDAVANKVELVEDGEDKIKADQSVFRE